MARSPHAWTDVRQDPRGLRGNSALYLGLDFKGEQQERLFVLPFFLGQLFEDSVDLAPDPRILIRLE
jgi:hypothetical protein